jgi:hypothetical protein
MQANEQTDPVAATWAAVQERLRAATAGEFQILRELGRGGMAAVYLAEDLALSRRVAIKVMSPALLLSKGMVGRFREEAITVAKLNHPNIITIHAVRQVGDLHFFVMNCVEGQSLETVLREATALSVPLALAILAQVGSALDYAHRHGVVHRDIKPANLLLDRQGNAIVTDFGIAKVAEVSGYTQTGLLIGTLAYMSPEQLEAQSVSGASDQYSLGMVLYEMLAGRPPFGGSTVAMIQGHLRDPVQPIRAARPDCPPELEAALLRMVDKDPANRWPSIADALRALQAIPLPPQAFTQAQLASLVGGVAETIPAAGAAVRPTITIVDPPDTLPLGRTTSLRVALPGAGHASAASVTWVSDNPDVIAVDDRGLLQAVGQGVATISAMAGGTHSIVRMRVVAATAELSAGPELPLPAPPEVRRRSRIARMSPGRRSPVRALAGAAFLGVMIGTGWFWASAAPGPEDAASAAARGAPTELPVTVPTPGVEGPTATPAPPPQADGPPGPDPGRVAAPPPARTAGDLPAPTAVSRSAEEEVRDVVKTFADLVASGNAQRVRGVYPELRGDEEWWRFVTEHAGQALRVSMLELLPGSPQMSEDGRAKVSFDLTFAYGQGSTSPWILSATVVRQGNQWRLSDVRYHR